MNEVIQNKIEELRELITHHNNLYFVKSEAEIADSDYDDLYRELIHLEAQHPEFDDPNSPTKRVGGKILTKLASIKHRYPISSLEKAYTTESVTEFYINSKSRCKHFTREEFSLGYIEEPKYDGLTLVLHYRDGVLNHAVTRGDGLYGNDVTHNAKVIESIPQTLVFEVQNLLVRGEAIIPKKEFERINAERRAANQPEYKTARNLVSGSMQQLDSAIVKTRGIQFIPYEVLAPYDSIAEGKCIYIYGKGHHVPYIIKTYEHALRLLKKLGFDTNLEYLKFDTLGAIYEHCCNDEFYNMLRSLPYDIDGFVIKVNSMKLRRELGEHVAHPYWQLAFKLPQIRHQARIKDVEWGIGKTGALTPVAVFNAVRIDGTDVSRASLHNMNEIKRLGLKINGKVLIEKAGGIIPAVIESIPDGDPSEWEYKEIEVPKDCPICGSAVTLSDTGLVKCPSAECSGTFAKKLIYFVGKKGLDIDGFGNKLCTSLVEQELVRSFSDVFSLSTKDLKPIVGNKIAVKIIEEIKSKHSVSLAKFLAILQIPNIGQTSSGQLALHFKTLPMIINASKIEIESIENFGPIATQSVYAYVRNAENLEEMDKLQNVLSIKEENVSTKLQGNFCITGVLSQPRKYFEDLISSNGGKVSGGVSKKLNYLIVGEDAGSKLEKAKELGISVLSEENFLKMLE